MQICQKCHKEEKHQTWKIVKCEVDVGEFHRVWYLCADCQLSFRDLLLDWIEPSGWICKTIPYPTVPNTTSSNASDNNYYIY